MSRRTILALTASLVMTGTMAATAVAGIPCATESTTDLWDVSQGAVMTSTSGFGGGTDTNMFGATAPSPETGVAFFRDDQADGFVHFVEWTTPDMVQVDSIHLRAAHDGNSPQRMFSSVNLYGWNAATSTFDQLYDLDPSFPYGDGMFNGGPIANLLDRCSAVPAMVTDRFRAEFVQAVTGSSFPGPRLIELDALGSVVLPTPAASVAASIPDAATAAPTHPGSPAATLGAALVLATALTALAVQSRRRAG